MPEALSENSEKQITAIASVAPTRAVERAGSASFKYYVHDSIEAFRLQLLGELAEADVAELRGCWRTARTTLGDRKLVLDLRGLKTVDEAGKQWLASMASEGASYWPDSYWQTGLAGNSLSLAENSRSGRRLGVLGKLLSFVKGSAGSTEPTQAP